MEQLIKTIKFTVNKYFKYTYPYILLVLFLLIPVTLKNGILGGIALVIGAYLVGRDIREYNKRQLAMEEEVKEANEEFDSVTRYAIFHMPYPMVMVDKDGYVTWQNNPFTEIVGEVLRNTKLSQVIPAITMSDLERVNESFLISYKEGLYKVRVDKVTSKGVEERSILYLQDVTETKQLEKAYENEGLVAMLLFLDNLDEVKAGGDEQFRARVQSAVDTTITNYFANYSAIVRKYDSDRYMVILERDAYNKIKAKKFDILDEMRELELGNSIPITLSVGVSDQEESPLACYEKARACVDIALGRGGDQAVCQTATGYDYFGGKTKSTQKRTKVKARIIGYALRQIIDDAPHIFISGHKDPDMDAIGAAVGLMSAVRLRKREAKMILGEDTVAVKSLLDMMKEEQPELLDSIISPEEALNSYQPGDLLILCDHHKPSLSPSKELSEKADNIVVIDHHRRGEEFVKNPALMYLEPHASSASELVTEILQYMSDDKKLTYFESTALLAGIMLDTKNFTVQTGVRTFDAASVLVRMGADPEEVKMLFRDDFKVFVNRARAIETAEIYRDRFAIALVQTGDDGAIMTAAQASDALLGVDGVDASFALADVGGSTHISARSNGKVSVQLIMESLGGGGHIAQAGAKLDLSCEEAAIKLKEAIETYEEEDKS
ncbi:MAG: DHH family phosphoesterase [Tissierellia bacterium]|nr:DHH family phosphoesterase [Tissierellia bacterium]